MQRPITLLIVFASLFLLGAVRLNPQVKNGEECSNASLEGTFGGYGAGTVVPDGTPYRSLIRSTYDGQGNGSNSFTINDNGMVRRGTASFTYAVNPDCTGTEFGAAGQPIFDFVLVDGGKEFYSVRIDPPNRVLTFIAKKQFP